jgi:hypothetical protein
MSTETSQMNTAPAAGSPPLWRRDRVAGKPQLQIPGFPSPLTPPHNGEENPVRAVGGDAP